MRDDSCAVGARGGERRRRLDGWVSGMLLGVVHALFAGTVLVTVLLPLVDPWMGTPFSAADTSPLLEARASCCSTMAAPRPR